MSIFFTYECNNNNNNKSNVGHVLSMAQIPKKSLFEILYIAIKHFVLVTIKHFIYIRN